MPAKKSRPPPKVGSMYRKEYRGSTYTMSVVRKGKSIGFECRGRVFTSPSSAAKSITGSEVNGWRFWNIETA